MIETKEKRRLYLMSKLLESNVWDKESKKKIVNAPIHCLEFWNENYIKRGVKC